MEGLCSQTEARWFYAFYSKVYERLQPYFTSSEMREAGLDLAAVAAGMDVLDVGAGTGTLSMQVVGRGVSPDRLTLIDQSEGMLSQARAKPELAGATTVLADAHTLPFGAESFDRVVSSGAIYYFPQPVLALREQMRVVRRGGVVLAMGSLQPKPLLLRLLATTFNRFPTEEEYVGWFEEAGLRDVRTLRISNPWNSKQYALAICGTRPQDNLPLIKYLGSRTLYLINGTRPQDGAVLPPADPLCVRKPRGSWWRLPLALARFSVAMGAFAILGPLQASRQAPGPRRGGSLHRSRTAHAAAGAQRGGGHAPAEAGAVRGGTEGGARPRLARGWPGGCSAESLAARWRAEGPVRRAVNPLGS